MSDFGKITVASALSALVHVTLFTLLALWSEGAPIHQPKERVEPSSLEVALQAAPAPVSEPESAQAVPASEEIPTSGNPDAIHTQLDPENLKKADHAPENPMAIAAHDSSATPNQPAESTPQPSPSPDSTPDPGALALESAAKPAPSPGAEIGIDALGSYSKAVGNAIGARFDNFRKKERDSLAVGEVRIKFAVDSMGRVSEVEVLSNNASELNAVFAERAVKEAIIPPIPPERLAQVPGGRIRIVYTFTIY